MADVVEPLELGGDVLDLPALLGTDLGAEVPAARAGPFGLGKVVFDDGDGQVVEVGDAATSAAGLGVDAPGVGGRDVIRDRHVLEGPGLERDRELEQQLAEVGRKTDGWAESVGAGSVEPLQDGEELGLEECVACGGAGELGVALGQHRRERRAQRLERLDVVGNLRGIVAEHVGMIFVRTRSRLRPTSGKSRDPDIPHDRAYRFTRRTLRRSIPSSSIASSLGRSSTPRTSGAAFGKRNVPASSRLYQRARPSRSQ